MEVMKYPEWKELTDRATNWEYGSTHTHKEIAEILILKEGSAKYRSSVSRAKKELEKLGKALKSVHGKGYIVMEANEYLNESTRYANKARINSRRVIEVLQVTPIERLNDKQKNIRDMMLDSGLRIVALTEGGFREIKTLQRNSLQLSSARG